MKEITLVKKDIPNVLDILNFSVGNKYTDSDSSIGEVALWTIGVLVAGKLLDKVVFCFSITVLETYFNCTRWVI